MNHKILIVFVSLFVTFMGTKAQNTKDKKGILLVTFGTSYPLASKAFDNIDNKVKAQWPDVEVRWAYTSKFIRAKLQRQGTEIDSPAQALVKMAEDGFTHIAVQSLHVIPGSEYHDLLEIVRSMQTLRGIVNIEVGSPLLCGHNDLQVMTDFIHNKFAKGLDEQSSLLLMGHGSHHNANVFYPGFQYYLNAASSKIHLATVEGYPLLDEAIVKMKARGTQKVLLTPFLSVAGDHAQNDMAGEEKDSWKSRLEEEGFYVEIIMKGLAEYDEVVDLWISHLKDIYHEL
ncbi:sirohydrochlorin cobaltochelatase [Marinilabilia rubra]|nr:sirohydrochlorin cobaltochelatase [Marinilabilia rubra]